MTEDQQSPTDNLIALVSITYLPTSLPKADQKIRWKINVPSRNQVVLGTTDGILVL